MCGGPPSGLSRAVPQSASRQAQPECVARSGPAQGPAARGRQTRRAGRRSSRFSCGQARSKPAGRRCRPGPAEGRPPPEDPPRERGGGGLQQNAPPVHFGVVLRPGGLPLTFRRAGERSRIHVPELVGGQDGVGVLDVAGPHVEGPHALGRAVDGGKETGRRAAVIWPPVSGASFPTPVPNLSRSNTFSYPYPSYAIVGSC